MDLQVSEKVVYGLSSKKRGYWYVVCCSIHL